MQISLTDPGPAGPVQATPAVNQSATLTLVDSNGQPLVTPVHLVRFSSDLNLQMTSGQVRDGMAHRPVRVQEMYLQFALHWPSRMYQQSQDLVEAIRAHYQYALGVAQPPPMQLSYPGIGRTWYGWIESVAKGDTRYTVIYEQTYRMRLINSANATMSTLDQLANPQPFVPGAADVANFGDQWYDFTVSTLPDPILPSQHGPGGSVSFQ